MTRNLRHSARVSDANNEILDENGVTHTTGRSLKKINYAEVESGLDFLDEETNSEAPNGDNHDLQEETAKESQLPNEAPNGTKDIFPEDEDVPHTSRRSGRSRRRKVHDPEEEDESFHEEDLSDDLLDDDASDLDDDEDNVYNSSKLRQKRNRRADDQFVVPDPEDEAFTEDGENDEDYGQQTGRRTRGRLTGRSTNSPSKTTNSGRRLRSRTRSTLYNSKENLTENNSEEALSLADEIRELQEDSPIREKRSLRERTKQVDYRIPPPLTNFPVEEYPTATASNIPPYATASPRRGRGGWNASQNAGPNRRLFPTGGPFGGNDVVTIFGQNTNFFGQNNANNPKLILDSDSSEDEILPIGGKSKRKPKNPLRDPKRKKKPEIADLDPLGVDMNIKFDDVGGLDNYIEQLKEMVSLPLLYPEVYQKFNITPPRGVLFHGPPGTGKTLMARALAASCSSESRKITFFMRKGADILSKWVGEAERQLRLLFEEAKKQQPSIIFFDEIDGLAPVRSSKQEQIHASIVSTLLALMDGMDNRGQVIVIGATNRPDAVDPALRRPGRFDREFYFPLPDTNARKTILKIHTKKWSPPLSDELIHRLASLTKGYGGADLRALCTEAALSSIQRTYPQIYRSSDKLLIDTDLIRVNSSDFTRALEKIVPSSNRSVGESSQPLPEPVDQLLDVQFEGLKSTINDILPDAHMKVSQSKSLIDEYMEYEDFTDDTGSDGFSKVELIKQITNLRTFRPKLLVTSSPGNGLSYIGSAILNFLEKFNVQRLDIPSLVADSTRTIEAAIVQAFIEARKRQPSIIFIPNFDIWMKTIPSNAIMTLSSLMKSLVSDDKVFLLCLSESLSEQDCYTNDLLASFEFATNIFEIEKPNVKQRTTYLKKTIENIKLPPSAYMLKRKRTEPLAKLPLAISGDSSNVDAEGKPLSKEELLRRKLKEFQHQDMKLKNVLKIKLSGLMDLFKNRYKRFRKPPIDDAFLVHLFEPQMQNIPNWQPAYVKDESMILEVATGKRFFNIDLDIIEERLWNGFYSEPKQFLKDIECIYRDANTTGDRERIIKASEMYANAQMGIEDISTPEFIAECKATRQRDIERQELYLEDERKQLVNVSNSTDKSSDTVDVGVAAGSQLQVEKKEIIENEFLPSSGPDLATNSNNEMKQISVAGNECQENSSNEQQPSDLKVDQLASTKDDEYSTLYPASLDNVDEVSTKEDKPSQPLKEDVVSNDAESQSNSISSTQELIETNIRTNRPTNVHVKLSIDEDRLNNLYDILIGKTDGFSVSQMEALCSRVTNIIWNHRENIEKNDVFNQIEHIVNML